MEYSYEIMVIPLQTGELKEKLEGIAANQESSK